MILGVGLGVVLAVMRLSDNPVLRAVAFAYTWFFRAMPRYVLLAILGSLGFLYAQIRFGVPFGQQIASSLGLSTDPVSYTHLRAHETVLDLVCRLLLEKKKTLSPTHCL